jgi:hypothetical protein
MRKRRTIAITTSFALLLLMTPMPMATADEPEREVIFDMYYNCICGLCPTGQVIGHWELDCNGNLSGWGEPLENEDGWCKTVTVSYGRYCSPQPQ